jgi:hypothetical protein
MTNENLGIGGWDEFERAYNRASDNGFIRVQQLGPLGRRAFLRTRMQYAWTDTVNQARVEQETIRVQDAFTSGGAQVRGGQHAKTFIFGSDMDYVRGNHTYRVGLQVDASKWRSDDYSNYLGTYTFESLDAYDAGRPRSYTRRIGDPNLAYNYFQGSIYAQDDVRVRRNLTLSAGVRYEAQAHVEDVNNVMPRFGITWAPGAAGTTTLRLSWGIFHDWLNNGTYEQTLRVDGQRQKELDIKNPSYPDVPVGDLVAAPVNRYILGDDYRLPRSNRVSVGIDRRYKQLQASATYAFIRGEAIARGENLNAPINGVRPDPEFGNIVEVISDGNGRQHQLQMGLTINVGALAPAPRSAPLINFKRSTLFLNYTIARNRNNSDGAFAVPATGDLEQEWGPAGNDVRHRMNINFNNQIIKNLGVGINLSMNTATPYTMRTGLDGNGDLIYNDRPAGVGRNTLRASNQFNLNMNVGYNWQFGPPVGGPPNIGVFVGGGGAAPEVRTFDQPARFRVGVFVQANNLTNHANYSGYSGVMTSPFFMQPTTVSNVRRVEAGVNFGF